MPGLRENLHERLAHELVIDEEFKSLIPPLLPEAYSGLEASIITEGCRDAIIIWGNIIIDGHNRYRICTAHNVPYKTKSMEFASRDEARLWMLHNQLARRNLTDFQRIEMVRKFEHAVKAQAEQRMLAGKIVPSGNLHKGRATDELGNLAGVSSKTYEHATEILDNAPEEIIQATRNDELSINAAYELTKMPKDTQQEVVQRISSGEKPKKVISDVKQRAKHQRTDMDYWNALIKNAERAAKKGQNIDAILAILNKAISIVKNANT